MDLQQTRTALMIFLLAALFMAFRPLRPPLEVTHNHYLFAAQSIAQGQGWQAAPYSASWGKFFAEWPPGYPLILAALHRLGVDLLTAAKALNTLAFAGCVTLVWVTVRRWRLALTAALFTPAFIMPFEQIWSEPLFILFTLLTVVLLMRRPLPLLAISIVGTLALMQRYAGIVWVFGAAAYIAVSYGWRTALAYLALPMVCLAGWAVRNIEATGHPFNERYPPIAGWGQNIEAVAATLIVWLLIVAACVVISEAVLWVRARLSR